MKNKFVLELIRLSPMGTASTTSLVKELSSGNNFEPVPWHRIQELFFACNIPLRPVKGQDYYVYYNYHPSSGYKTSLYINDEGKISFKVHPPSGGVLCAFWSEIVIFCLTDRTI